MCAKPRPPLTPLASGILEFVERHCIRHVQASAMGDVMGFDVAWLAFAAGCYGFEVGPRELRLIEVLEEEYREFLKAARERRKQRAENGMTDDDEPGEGAEVEE